MIGTIVNTACIVVGSIVGSVIRKGINDQYKGALFTAIGLAAFCIGVNAVAKNMPDSTYPVLFVVSLAMGSLVGTVLDVDARFNKLVALLGTTHLGQGLSTAILLFCIGTLSILGPIQSAVQGDNTLLFTNATLDLVTSMVLASTYGIGIILSAVVLFCWQGIIYLGATYLSIFLTPQLMTEVSIVGGILILCSGISILGIKELKTMNLLPSLLIPVLWFLIKIPFGI